MVEARSLIRRRMRPLLALIWFTCVTACISFGQNYNISTFAGTTVLLIYCTGLGGVTNQPPTGSPALSSLLSKTMTTPIVTIGGAPADVQFSGLAPGLVGLYQVNAAVPAAAAKGNAVPVVVSIGGVMSNAATISVQ